MAIPVIDTTTSVLGYRQWEYWEYQPWAANEPTAWSSSPLPPGLALDTETGKISGAATAPGVFLASLWAENIDGQSDPILLKIGIEASAILPNSGADLFIDVTTRKVTFAGMEGSDDPQSPLFWAKMRDDLVMFVRFVKQSTVLDLDLGSLAFGIKEFEPDRLLQASGDWQKIGQGNQTYYRLHIRFDGTLIEAALSNYETDDGTRFLPLCEFEWLENNDGDVGPAELRSSSRNFRVSLDRDILQKNIGPVESV